MSQTTNQSKTKRLLSLYEWVGAVTASLVTVAILSMFLFRVINVDGTSMMNTLQHGETLILSRLPYTPNYEDIVVLRMDGREAPLIKRVIGLAGDTIEVDADGGVYRNGVLLEEPYVHAPTASEQMTRAVSVPEGYVFVMGDNRAQGGSLDSRTFGCVPAGDIMGKAVLRLFPLDRFGGIYDQS